MLFLDINKGETEWFNVRHEGAIEVRHRLLGEANRNTSNEKFNESIKTQ